jgi:hypothetical protein
VAGVIVVVTNPLLWVGVALSATGLWGMIRSGRRD